MENARSRSNGAAVNGDRAPSSVEFDASRRALITVCVMLASIMQSIDITIANVALPRIQATLSATQDQMAWVLTSYIVASAIMTPLSGWLAAQFGRKRIFLISISGFTAASMLCGLAQSLEQIVLARLLQGLFGAALVPLSQAVLLDINPPAAHGRAMAIWIMGATLGPVLGPALGGWLTENYDWRWVFYINVPFGVLAFLGMVSYLPDSKIRRSRFDFFGFTSLSLAIAALQIMLDRGQVKDWFGSTEICIEAAVAALAFYMFVVHTVTTDKPSFVSTALFKDRSFVTGNIFMFAMGAILFSTLALLPPLLEDLLNFPVVTTGLVTSPRGIGSILALFVVGRIAGRIDNRLIIGVGFTLTAYSLWQMTGFDLQMDTAKIVWSGFVQGLGNGFILVPVSAAAFATLAPALRNEGTAIFSLLRNLGSSIGIPVMETLLTRNTQIMHASLAAHVTRYRTMLPQGSASLPSLAKLNAAMTQQAAMVAYNDDFKIMMLLSLAAIPLVFLLRKGGVPESEAIHLE